MLHFLRMLLLFSLLFAGSTYASPVPPDALFPTSEKLKFGLTFIDTTAGECLIETLPSTTWQGRPAHHFRATVKTVGLIRLMYPYTETVDLYLDRERITPL